MEPESISKQVSDIKSGPITTRRRELDGLRRDARLDFERWGFNPAMKLVELYSDVNTRLDGMTSQPAIASLLATKHAILSTAMAYVYVKPEQTINIQNAAPITIILNHDTPVLDGEMEEDGESGLETGYEDA